jgi:hypothetical protein
MATTVHLRAEWQPPPDVPVPGGPEEIPTTEPEETPPGPGELPDEPAEQPSPPPPEV